MLIQQALLLSTSIVADSTPSIVAAQMAYGPMSSVVTQSGDYLIWWRTRLFESIVAPADPAYTDLGSVTIPAPMSLCICGRVCTGATEPDQYTIANAMHGYALIRGGVFDPSSPTDYVSVNGYGLGSNITWPAAKAGAKLTIQLAVARENQASTAALLPSGATSTYVYDNPTYMDAVIGYTDGAASQQVATPSPSSSSITAVISIK